MRTLLIDAGPLVALLSTRDNDHERCVEVFKQLRTTPLTTWMAVTEAIYLLGFSVSAQEALLEMIERGAVCVADLDVSDIPPIRGMIRQYADLPMDFTDASLVHIARKNKLDTIFTLDHRDFSVYRLARGKSFSIIPVES